MFVTGSKKPTPNLIWQKLKLVKPYQGRTEATVVECIGRNAFGVPMYGCHLEGYVNPCHPDQMITVDFAANEFAGEMGEAYQGQHERGFAWLKQVLGEE